MWYVTVVFLAWSSGSKWTKNSMNTLQIWSNKPPLKRFTVWYWRYSIIGLFVSNILCNCNISGLIQAGDLHPCGPLPMMSTLNCQIKTKCPENRKKLSLSYSHILFLTFHFWWCFVSLYYETAILCQAKKKQIQEYTPRSMVTVFCQCLVLTQL